MKKSITKIGNILIKIIAGLTAVLFSFYGLLMLWDMVRTDIKAFASYDLLKYRPNIEEDAKLMKDFYLSL